VRSLEQSNVAQEASPRQTLLQDLEAVNLHLADQGKKMDLGYNQTLQLKE